MDFERSGNQLKIKLSNELIVVEPFGKDCIRFRSSINREIVNENWNLLPQTKSEAKINIEFDKAVMQNGKITFEISTNGMIKYFNDHGEILLEELWLDGKVNNADLLHARNYKAISSDLYKIDLYFKAFDDERFYGMGQYANDYLDLKGCTLELAQKNTQVSIPFLISTNGYGFIWNNPSIGRTELAKNHTLWHVEAARQIDYLVFYGETPSQIVQKYSELTGKAPMLPEWAMGFWQCKLRYRTQEEILSIAREYKKRNLPLSVIVVDFFHWPYQGDWRFDLKYWPDVKSMVNELNKMGIKLMVSVWPTVDLNSENYSEMLQKGLLVRTDRGVPITFTFRGSTTQFDATDPESREFVWDKIKENYYNYGIKTFWLDEAEPEMRPYDFENVRYSIGNGAEVSNIYPYYYAQTFHDGLKSSGEKETVNLIRSAWLGSQRFGIVLWSGDIPSTFDSLRKQLKAGLNVSMSGIPWWTTDIGGFYGGDPDDPKFRELIVRWFQFGTFCPIFRLHGFRNPYPTGDQGKIDAFELTGGPNEIWSFGDEAYNIIKNLLFLREKMKPYILEQMEKAHEDGIPVIRPLFFDFPEDKNAFEIEDEYMFGSDILVAPVLYEGMKKREIYLPNNVKWISYDTKKTFNGGQKIEYESPLNVIPIFFKNDVKKF